MAINTYSTLQTAIGNWLARSDLTTVIPDFIMLAEAEFNRVLRVREMESRATATATEYLELPSDFLELRTVQLNTSPVTVLSQVSPEVIDGYTTTGKPVCFTIIDNRIQLGPSPDSTYTVEIDYYAQIPALSGSNTTNWLLTSYPDLYLYGSLLRAAGYIQDANLAMGWQQAYKNSLDQLRYADKRARFSGGPMTVTPG